MTTTSGLGCTPSRHKLVSHHNALDIHEKNACELRVAPLGSSWLLLAPPGSIGSLGFLRAPRARDREFILPYLFWL